MTRTCCPHCGKPMTTPADREADLWRIVAELRDWCDEHGIRRAPGERIREADAARLLDRAPGTLGNWRLAGAGPKHSAIGRTTYYALPDLAAFIMLGHE